MDYLKSQILTFWSSLDPEARIYPFSEKLKALIEPLINKLKFDTLLLSFKDAIRIFSHIFQMIMLPSLVPRAKKLPSGWIRTVVKWTVPL